MMFRTKKKNRQKGIALIIVLIFVTIFSALSVSLFTMSATSVQAASNQQAANGALNAAQSGLEYARYLASDCGTINIVLDYQAYKDGDFSSQADTIWSNLCSTLQDQHPSSTSGENWIEGEAISFDDSGATFTVRFERDDYTITTICNGRDSGINRTIKLSFEIGKADDEILNYGIVGRGRMWLAGDTTIHGDVYSSWDNINASPFNMTEDSTVLGTINTALSWQDILKEDNFEMQTFLDHSGDLVLDDNKLVDLQYDNGYLLTDLGSAITDSSGNPINIFDLDFETVNNEYNIAVDNYGNPIEGFVGGESIGTVTYGNPVETFEEDGDRAYGSNDELLGTYESANYGQDKGSIDTYLDIDSYDTGYYYDITNANPIEPVTTTETDVVRSGRWPNYTYTTVEVEVPVTTREYFPHGDGGYDDSKSGSVTLNRNTYEETTYTDAYLSSNQNALFKDCTFEGVLYIDCSQQTSSNYNNVRFENCEFNGVIVTNTPNSLKWQYNALYFTGSANFNNTSDIQEATILAPHFNVNLGDANNGEVESDENVITGAVVGGIVDIRGNAEILGTVISMCDTSQWTSGYVTNIGATLGDGGSETTSVEDVGTIDITPDTEQTLFPGLKEYPCTISLTADSETYTEIN